MIASQDKPDKQYSIAGDKCRSRLLRDEERDNVVLEGWPVLRTCVYVPSAIAVPSLVLALYDEGVEEKEGGQMGMNRIYSRNVVVRTYGPRILSDIHEGRFGRWVVLS